MKKNNLEEKTKKGKLRRYNGNPLAYYAANYELYKDMNRSQLNLFDPGLYKSLHRAGQLEQAIPKVNEIAFNLGKKLGKGEVDLSEEDINKIIDSYGPYNGNAARAAKYLHFAQYSVLKYWKRSGLKIHEKGSTFSQEKIQRIIDSYELCNGNALRASKYLNCTVSTVLRHWRIAGLETQPVGKPKVRV